MPSIVARIFCRPDALRTLAADATIRAQVDLEARLYFDIDTVSPLWLRVLDATKRTTGLAVTPIMSPSRAEMEQATHFQLRPAAILRETESDYWANKRHLDNLRPIGSGAADLKLLDEISISAGRLKGSSVAAAGDWTEEYVATPSALADLRLSGLHGFEERFVRTAADDTVRADLIQIFSKCILAPAVWNESTLMVEDPPPTPPAFRQLGWLTYQRSALAEATDFNRTAEPWAGNSMPTWVVSAGVRAAVKNRRIRGWRFLPVLVANTPLYDEYRSRWVSLSKQLTEANPRNSFR